MSELEMETALAARERLAEECARMEQMLAEVPLPGGPAAADIHAIRKLAKSLRGGLALIGLKRNAARDIQAVGRLFGSARDAASRRHTWERLGWNDDPAAALAIGHLLDQQARAADRQPPAESIDWCRQRVALAQGKVRDLEADELPDRLSKGFKKIRRGLRKKLGALDRRGGQAYHDARKAVKAYLGARDYMVADSTTVDPRLVELAEVLGDENDLATLAAWLRGHGFTKRHVPGLWNKLVGKKHQLRKAAARDAAAILDEDIV